MGEVFVYLAPPCIRGRGADITSLRVEHSHKTCFLYSLPNVNNLPLRAQPGCHLSV